MIRAAILLPLALAGAGCNRNASTSEVPVGQEAKVARINANSPTTAPAREGGIRSPRQMGERIPGSRS